MAWLNIITWSPLELVIHIPLLPVNIFRGLRRVLRLLLWIKASSRAIDRQVELATIMWPFIPLAKHSWLTLLQNILYSLRKVFIFTARLDSDWLVIHGVGTSIGLRLSPQTQSLQGTLPGILTVVEVGRMSFMNKRTL